MKLAILLLLASTAFAQEVKRPTFEIDSGATVKCGEGTAQTSTGMPNAYDATGQSTSSVIATQATTVKSFYRSRSFSAWQAAGSTYSALTLNVNAQEVESNLTGSVGEGLMQYSINNGSTWTNLVTSSGSGFSRKTYSATLSAMQDLSQLKVAVCVQSSAGGDTSGPIETMTVFDIWTVGTTTAQSPGPGATTGSPHRGLVIVN